MNRPTLTLQTVVLLSLLSCLYAILKLRYRRRVWRALGWTRPRLRHGVIAVFGGAALAMPIALFVRWSGWVMPSIRLWDLVLLGAFLGPALEESFFRGCLLPVLARTAGVPLAILLSALFTALHKPATLAQWVFRHPHGSGLRLDARQLPIHGSSHAHAFGLQCDALRLPDSEALLGGLPSSRQWQPVLDRSRPVPGCLHRLIFLISSGLTNM